MDKKTTKKQYYYLVLSYNAIFGEERKTIVTTIQTDNFPTMGTVNYVARMHYEKNHPEAEYIENAAIITFFAKLSKSEYLATQDKSVPTDITVNF